MNIRDLQYLVAVYDLQSFSKAAEHCFVSQPTLSGQLKKLESRLGTTLIERSTRQILFTDAGQQVVAKAREVLNKVAEIESLARQYDDPMTGNLHLGLIPTIGPYLLPKIVPLIRQQYPQLKLFLHELQTHTLLQQLQNGQLDGAIMAKVPWEQNVKEWLLYHEPLLLAVNANDALVGKRKSVNLETLQNRKMLMLEDGHCLRDQAMGVCFAEGADEDKQFQATSMSTLLHMVASGAGSTLVPELACDKSIDDVMYLPFNPNAPSREVVLIARRDSARAATFSILGELISAQINQV